MIKAVLFDLDGTIIDTIVDLALSVNAVLLKNGYPTHTLEQYKYFAGNGNQTLIKRALPEDKRDDETVLRIRNEFYDYYEKHCADNAKAFDGILPLFEQLRQRGIMKAIVTNKNKRMTDAIVPLIFKDEHFDAIVGQTDTVPVKPEPDMAFMAMSRMDVNPDECLFVGDSGVDIYTGRNSGNTPVGVLWGFRSEEELRNAGARYIVSHPSQIIDIIDEINK